MSPVDITLVVASALLLALVAVLTVTLRQVVRRASGLETAVHGLREQVEEMSRRESVRETTTEPARPAESADWVITFDGQEEPSTVPTQRVVSATLGEPLIKVAAFSHGIRQALREERRAHLAHQVRREYRRRRRATRARARAAQRTAQ